MTLESFMGGWREEGRETSAVEYPRVCPRSKKLLFWHASFLDDIRFHLSERREREVHEKQLLDTEELHAAGQLQTHCLWKSTSFTKQI